MFLCVCAHARVRVELATVCIKTPVCYRALVLCVQMYRIVHLIKCAAMLW